MPAPIRMVLSEAEDLALSALRTDPTVPQRTRDRAHMVRLNAQGWNAPAIAEVFNCHAHTVRGALKRWSKRGIEGLTDAPGRGVKSRWSESDLQVLEQALEEEPRTYNSAQLAKLLQQRRQVDLSGDWIRRLLKKRAMSGSAPATLNAANKTQSKKPSRGQT